MGLESWLIRRESGEPPKVGWSCLLSLDSGDSQLSSCFSSLLESSDESSLATSPLRHRLPQSMKIVHEIMYKVEVLYVLCVLLMGRQRNQVHFFLTEFQIIKSERGYISH